MLIKGFLVGICKIIPGVSGAMLALTLGIYERLIEALTNFFNKPKENFKILFNFGIGCFLAIILFSKLLLFLLNHYYYEVIYLFLGLIMGTLINFVKKLKFNKKNIIIFLILSSLLLIISNLKTYNTFIFKGSFSNYLYTLLLGMIDAATSIIPGISGTVIYMLLGSYQYILSILSNPWSLAFIVFIIGLILGIIIVSYLMNYLFKYKKDEIYIAIFSFMVSSLIILFGEISHGFSLKILLFLSIGFIGGWKIRE